MGILGIFLTLSGIEAALTVLQEREGKKKEKKIKEESRRREKEERRKNPIPKTGKGSKWDLSNEEMYKEVELRITNAKFKIGQKVYFYYWKEKKAFPVKVTNISITGKFFKYDLKELSVDAYGHTNEYTSYDDNIFDNYEELAERIKDHIMKTLKHEHWY